MRTFIPIAAGLLLTGCGTFQKTAGQSDSFGTRQTGYRLSAEELAAIPVLVDEKTVDFFDAEGRLIRREVSSLQRGYPTALRATETRTSAAFTDAAMGLEQDANPAGSRVRLNRNTQGNAETLNLTTTAQVQRAEADAKLIGAVVEGAIGGAVRAIVEGVVPVRLAQEAGRTERRAIEATRDIEIKRLEAATPEGGPEPEARPE
jgi:hypothetical protein